MGLENWLTKFFMGGKTGAPEFLEVLASFPPPTDPKLSEGKFRNELHSFLASLGGVDLKREAGITGLGTRIDLYAHFLDHDYLITIKKGLSEQKVKKVLGEIAILLDHWKPRVPGNLTYVVFYPFAITDEMIEYLAPFERFCESHGRKDFVVTFATPTGGDE